MRASWKSAATVDIPFVRLDDVDPLLLCKSTDVSQRQELRSLTGIRAFACLWVLLLHVGIICPKVLDLVASHWFLAPIRQGFLGVDLFFLLSGFILSYNYARPGAMIGFRGYLRFLGLRVARIYPVHLFTLLLMIPLLFGSRILNGNWPEWSGVPSFVANIFLVNGWNLPVSASWNEPAWSVSTEWLAYLAFPACLMLTSRVNTRARAAIFFLGCFATFTGLCQWAVFPSSSSYGLFRIVFEFISGCALFRLYSLKFGSGFFRSSRADVLLLLCIAVLFAGAALLPARMPSQVWFVPVLALALYALSWGGGYVSGFLSTPAAEFFGHASYAIYMVQFPSLLLLNKFLRAPAESSLLMQLGTSFFYLLATIVVGIIVHLYIENPARTFCRKLTKYIVSKHFTTSNRPLPAVPESA